MELAVEQIAIGSVETKRKSQTKKSAIKLQEIMAPYARFDDAITQYIDSLSKKRAWKRLEHQKIRAETNGWNTRQLTKFGQWEKKACDMFREQQELALELIKDFAKEMKEEDLEPLEEWIATSKTSKEAWSRKIVSIDDRRDVITARIVHLIYMVREPKKVNIGALIKKVRSRG